MSKHTHPAEFTGKKMTYEEQKDLWPTFFGNSKRKVPYVGIDLIYDLSRRNKLPVVRQLGWNENEPWRKTTTVKTDIVAHLPKVWEVLNKYIDKLTPELLLANRMPSGKKLTRELCTWPNGSTKISQWKELISAINEDMGMDWRNVPTVDVASNLYTYIVSLRADNEIMLSFEFKDMIAGSYDPDLTWGSCFKKSSYAVNVSSSPQMGIISTSRGGKVTGRAWVYVCPDSHFVSVYKPYGDLTRGVAQSVIQSVANAINPTEAWVILNEQSIRTLTNTLNVNWPSPVANSGNSTWYLDPRMVYAVTQAKITEIATKSTSSHCYQYSSMIREMYKDFNACHAPCAVCGKERNEDYRHIWGTGGICNKCSLPADMKCRRCGKTADHETLELCTACVAAGYTQCEICGAVHKADGTCPVCNARVHCNYCGEDCTTEQHVYINRYNGICSLEKPEDGPYSVACKSCYTKLCNHVCECCDTPIDISMSSDDAAYVCNGKVLCGKCAAFFSNMRTVENCLESALKYGVKLSTDVQTRIDFGIKYLGLEYTGFNKKESAAAAMEDLYREMHSIVDAVPTEMPTDMQALSTMIRQAHRR